MVELENKSRKYLLPVDIKLIDHVNSNPNATG